MDFAKKKMNAGCAYPDPQIYFHHKHIQLIYTIINSL